MARITLRLSSSGELFRNFALLTLSGFGTRALGFITVLVLARRLGAGSFGQLNFAQALIAYFILMADFGTSTLGIRELAARRDAIRNEVSRFLFARLGTGAFASVLLVMTAILLPRPASDRLLILIFGLSVIATVFTVEWVFRAVERMGVVATGSLIGTLVSLGLVLLFVNEQTSILIVPFFLAAGAFARVVFYWGMLLRDYGGVQLTSSWQQVGGTLNRATTLGLAYLMIQIYYNIDTLLLGFYRSNEEVGWYNAAYRLVLAFTALAGIVGDVIFPRLSRLSQSAGASEHGPIMVLGAKVLLYLALPVALGGTLFGEGIIFVLYGAGYVNSAPVLRVIIWQAFAVFCNVSFAYYLLATHHQHHYLVSVTAGAVLNLAMNLVLIPHYGMLGAAAATIAAEVVVLGLLYWFASQHVAPAPILTPALKALAAGGAFAAVSVLIDNLWLGLTIGTLAYFVVLSMTKPLTPAEIKRLLPWSLS